MAFSQVVGMKGLLWRWLWKKYFTDNGTGSNRIYREWSRMKWKCWKWVSEVHAAVKPPNPRRREAASSA